MLTDIHGKPALYTSRQVNTQHLYFFCVLLSPYFLYTYLSLTHLHTIYMDIEWGREGEIGDSPTAPTVITGAVPRRRRTIKTTCVYGGVCSF